MDAKNNTYAGPENQFTIVIDKFDGKTVQAWHIETPRGKTANLAERGKGKHIDLVLGERNSTTRFYFRAAYADLYKEQAKKLEQMAKK